MVCFYFIGSSFGALSGGRVTIIQICIAYVTKALTIAIRYAGVRKQFGPNEKEELPVLEYQLIVRLSISK